MLLCCVSTLFCFKKLCHSMLNKWHECTETATLIPVCDNCRNWIIDTVQFNNLYHRFTICLEQSNVFFFSQQLYVWIILRYIFQNTFYWRVLHCCYSQRVSQTKAASVSHSSCSSAPLVAVLIPMHFGTRRTDELWGGVFICGRRGARSSEGVTSEPSTQTRDLIRGASLKPAQKNNIISG